VFLALGRNAHGSGMVRFSSALLALALIDWDTTLAAR
jgi:hypothetical protein